MFLRYRASASPAHHGIVAVVTGGLKRKLAQPRQGEIVQQDGDAVFLFQIHEVCADALPLRADFAGFPVGGIFGKSWESTPFQ